MAEVRKEEGEKAEELMAMMEHSAFRRTESGIKA
jgi:hypothetical protein